MCGTAQAIFVALSVALVTALVCRTSVLRATAVDTIDYLTSLHYLVLGQSPEYDLRAPTRFLAPQGVAYDTSGRLYVTDTDYVPWGSTTSTADPHLVSDRVRVFGPDHQYLYDLAPARKPFFYPVGLTLDAGGRLLVADSGNDRLVLFSAADDTHQPQELLATGVHGNYDPLDPDGAPGGAPLTPLTLWYPSGVSIKPGTYVRVGSEPADPAARVAVVDNSNHRVVVLDSKLLPLYAFGGHTVGTTDAPAGFLEYPWAIAIDAAGRYYVSDSENNRVQVFQEDKDASGRPAGAHVIRVFGSSFTPGANGTFVFGSDPGDMGRPYGLTFDTSGRLWMADPDNHRIMRIDVTRSLSAAAAAQLTPCSVVASAQDEHHCVIVASDGQRYDALVFGARGGAGSGALFNFPQAIAESPTHGLAVADTDNDSIQLFTSSTMSVAFTGTGTIDAGPRALNQPFQFGASVKNDGAVAANVTVTPTANLRGTFTGATTALVAPGTTKDFTFFFTPAEPGALTLTVAGSASASVLVGNSLGFGSLVMDGGGVPPGIGLAMAANADRAVVGVGDAFTVTVRLQNTGTTPLTNAAAKLVIDDATLVAAAGPDPGAVNLAGLASANLTFTYTAVRAGTVAFTASGWANYVDPQNQAAKSLNQWLPVSVSIVDDLSAPIAAATVPAVPAGGWYNTPFVLQLAAADEAGGSGVKSITFRVVQENATATVAGSHVEFVFNRQGNTEVQYYATDNAGNRSASKSLFVKLDSVAPDMGAAQVSPALPASGWYRIDPTITFVAGDGAGGSGIATLTDPQVVSTNGARQWRTGVAIDNAGNRSQTATASVNVDKAAPALVCAPTVTPNAFGWYTSQSSVTVLCAATDQAGLSGLASVSAFCQGRPPATTSLPAAGSPAVGPLTATASCTLGADGVWDVYGAATDVAGNTTTTLAFKVRIDRTPPTVVCGTASGGEVWPPSHKMIAWNTSVLVKDLVSGSAGFTLKAFSSSEALNALGDGTTVSVSQDMSDWTIGTADTFGYIRSERSGAGTGRIYRLLYVGVDAAGNTSSCVTVLTGVPHDQGGN